MRLKTYSAPSVRAAMDAIRRELGPDAIIVGTQRAAKGVRVTAAGDQRPPPRASASPLPRLRQILAAHGLPEPLRLRLLEAAERAAAADPGADAERALAAALAAVLRFDPLPAGKAERPLLLVGPPGAGKTSLAGKLAARAWADQRSVRVITTDLARAGGLEQLRAYTGALSIGLRSAADRIELKAALAGAASADLVLIDTTGVNPFDSEEMGALIDLRQAIDAEPLLVLAGGVDSEDGGELAAAFAVLGCRRLCVTRLDIARRLGGLLGLVDAEGLALAGLSHTARIAHGLLDADARALAQRLLAFTPRAAAAPRRQEVHA